MLAKEMRKNGYGISNSRSTRALNEAASSFGLSSVDDLFAAIGSNKITARAVSNKASQLLEKEKDPALEAEKRALLSFELPMKAPRSNRQDKKSARSNSGIIVEGDENTAMKVKLAHCCNPVKGDDIIGFVTRGRGVSVHRSSCPNIQNLERHPERLVQVTWDSGQEANSQVEIVIEAVDRMRLLQDITLAIADSDVNILSAATFTDKSGVAELRLLLELSEISRLDALLRKVKQIGGVRNARRLQPGEGAHTKKKN